ncbi:MAG: hypothetical protein ISQ13_02845 [Candidatus Margulisbacteria bacterium]|nr:hypothetical protein [Candidatus Margulisiibacteriota bacterium]
MAQIAPSGNGLPKPSSPANNGPLPSPGGPQSSDNQSPSLGPLSQLDLPLPRPPVFSMTTKEADAYSKLNVLLHRYDTLLPINDIRELQRELCDPTFDDFFY